MLNFFYASFPTYLLDQFIESYFALQRNHSQFYQDFPQLVLALCKCVLCLCFQNNNKEKFNINLKKEQKKRDWFDGDVWFFKMCVNWSKHNDVFVVYDPSLRLTTYIIHTLLIYRTHQTRMFPMLKLHIKKNLHNFFFLISIQSI